jgi:hypothetical protein
VLKSDCYASLSKVLSNISLYKGIMLSRPGTYPKRAQDVSHLDGQHPALQSIVHFYSCAHYKFSRGGGNTYRMYRRTCTPLTAQDRPGVIRGSRSRNAHIIRVHCETYTAGISSIGGLNDLLYLETSIYAVNDPTSSKLLIGEPKMISKCQRRQIVALFNTSSQEPPSFC